MGLRKQVTQEMASLFISGRDDSFRVLCFVVVCKCFFWFFFLFLFFLGRFYSLYELVGFGKYFMYISCGN